MIANTCLRWQVSCFEENLILISPYATKTNLKMSKFLFIFVNIK